MLSTAGVPVNDSFSKADVAVHVYPCGVVVDYPIAVKVFNTIRAPGVENSTCCEIFSQKTISVRQDRAMNSAHVFYVSAMRCARTQYHTEAIEATIDRLLVSSDTAMKVSLHANGI